MKNFNELKKELLQNKDVAREYERLKPRYRLISELISARIRKGITQKELAEKWEQNSLPLPDLNREISIHPLAS